MRQVVPTVKLFNWFPCNTETISNRVVQDSVENKDDPTLGSLSEGVSTDCTSECAAQPWTTLHQERALTMIRQQLTFAPSTIERIGSNKISQSEVDWVISSAG